MKTGLRQQSFCKHQLGMMNSVVGAGLGLERLVQWVHPIHFSRQLQFVLVALSPSIFTVEYHPLLSRSAKRGHTAAQSGLCRVCKLLGWSVSRHLSLLCAHIQCSSATKQCCRSSGLQCLACWSGRSLQGFEDKHFLRHLNTLWSYAIHRATCCGAFYWLESCHHFASGCNLFFQNPKQNLHVSSCSIFQLSCL